LVSEDVQLEQSTDRSGLVINVMATTPGGTRAALERVKRLGAATAARVLLLVPHVTSFSTSPQPVNNHESVMKQFHDMATEVGVHASLLACVCRRREDIARTMLGPSSLLVIGGRHGRLWPSTEERLARRLTAEGYAVVFVQAGSNRAPARGAA